jgi:hypothetical protein
MLGATVAEPGAGDDAPTLVPAPASRDVDEQKDEEASVSELTLPPVGSTGAHDAPSGAAATVRQRQSRVDRWLPGVAVASSVPALVVLAGLPSADSAAGSAVRGVVLALFWLLAPGSAVAGLLRLSPMTKVAQVPVIGLGLLTTTSTVGLWAGLWIPRLGALVIAAGALIVGARSLRAHWRGPLLPRPARPDHLGLLLGAGLGVAVVLWAIAVPRIKSADPSVLGLLVSGPRLLPVALLLVVAVVLIAVRGARTVTVAAGAATLILILRTTASAATSVPIPLSAYKHIGVVGALQANHHTVDDAAQIYMSWPAMFAASGWFSDSSGVAVTDIARFFPLMVHLVIALATAALARALGARATASAAAAVLVVVLNWVGQDYFAPQALAMCLAAGVLVLLVQSRTGRTYGVLALLLYAVIVPTHQLTPFWLLGLAFVLMVLRRTAWWVVLGMALIAFGFLASRYDVVASYGLFSGFDVVSNAASNVAPVPAQGRDVAGWFAKGTAALMWLSTLGVLLARVRRAGWRDSWRPDGAVIPFVLAFSPFALLAAQSYGGEAVLRVTLYSTVGCAAVLGPALAGAMQRTKLAVAGAALWTVVLVGVAAQASFGSWYLNYLRPEDVSAARWLSAEHPDALVVPVIADWPGRGWIDAGNGTTGEDVTLDNALRRQAFYTHQPLDQSLTVDAGKLAQVAAQEAEGAPVYVVFTAAMRAYDAYYATYAPGGYQGLLDDLSARPDWTVARHEGDLWVLTYTGPAAPTD